MKIRLIDYWETLRGSYWFLPVLLTVLAAALAVGTIELDEWVLEQFTDLPTWVDTGGPDGARALLSTVAASTITMASVSFSITIVALTLASSQFGPRLLNNFMRDTGNQIVLGTFIATFVYSVLVLRTVRSVVENEFVPHISVTIAVVLALAGLLLFIYFIHHISDSINVQNVTAAVERDLNQAIDRLYPEKKSGSTFDYELRHEEDIPAEFEEGARPVAALKSGYLQAIDNDGLVKLATKQGLLIRLEHRPGDFIASGSTLVRLWPDETVDEEVSEKVNEAFLIGAERLRLQDVKFAIDQLVEIAVRALSPGINDPFTAMTCIDRLGAALANAAERRIPSGYRYDEENNLRLITHPVTFAGLVDAAFNQIRRNSRSNVAVTIRLLETIAVIAAHTRTPADHESLWRLAILIKQGSESTLPLESDRQDVLKKFERVRQSIKDS